MAFLFFIVMVAVVITAEYFLHRRERQAATETESPVLKAAPVKQDVNGVVVSPELSFHPLHTWASRVDARTARIGIDDFGRRLIGQVDKVTLPIEGIKLEAGQSCVKLVNGKRVAAIVAPLSGDVLEVNSKLKEHPELVFEDPYGEGWLFTVRSWRLIDQLKSLLSGELAITWMRGAVERLHISMPNIAGAVAQDGGMLCDDLSEHLDRYEWTRMVRENLGTEPMENK